MPGKTYRPALTENLVLGPCLTTESRRHIVRRQVIFVHSLQRAGTGDVNDDKTTDPCVLAGADADRLTSAVVGPPLVRRRIRRQQARDCDRCDHPNRVDESALLHSLGRQGRKGPGGELEVRGLSTECALQDRLEEGRHDQAGGYRDDLRLAGERRYELGPFTRGYLR